MNFSQPLRNFLQSLRNEILNFHKVAKFSQCRFWDFRKVEKFLQCAFEVCELCSIFHVFPPLEKFYDFPPSNLKSTCN